MVGELCPTMEYTDEVPLKVWGETQNPSQIIDSTCI